MTEAQICNKISNLNIPLQSRNLFVVYLELDGYAKLLEYTSYQDMNQIDFAITNILTELLETTGIGVLSRNSTGQYYIIGNIKEDFAKSGPEAVITPVFVRLSELIKSMFSLALTAGISSIHNGFTDISLAYKQAEKAFRYRFFVGKGILISFSNISRLRPSQDKLILRSEFMLTALSNKNLQQLKNEIDKVLKDVFSKGCMEKDIRTTVSEILLLVLYKSMEKASGEIDTINIPFHIMEEIKRIDTLSELKTYLHEQAETLFCYYWDSRNDADSSNIADKIKKYVENNYVDNINLNVIAQSLNINPCYASIVFKSKTGINFIDYFINYRITKAKEFMMARPNVSINRVGTMVGYQNPQYFCKVFKKQVGMSASEYRRIATRDSSECVNEDAIFRATEE